MANAADGMNYAPEGKSEAVVGPDAFKFGVIGLDHGHIFGQCNGLTEAGATLVKVFDPDPEKVAKFVEKFPQAAVAKSKAEILEDESIQLVAAAAIPCDRGPLGCEVMRHGKDYFTDKAPFTTLAQLAEARSVAAETGQKNMVYFSERLHVESAVYAGELIHKQGAIGKVIQVMGLGPHRLGGTAQRPAWFFEREKYGGILTDIGSHQVEQFLYYTGATDAQVLSSAIGNYDNSEHPELDDWGQFTVVGDNGATGYHRVDWFTPDGLRTWGDGRLVILGTEGYIEVRKYVDVATDRGGDQVILVDKNGEQRFEVAGKVGFPFFGELILDCMNRTENAMTQAHVFKAAEISLQAQQQAVVVTADGGRPTIAMDTVGAAG